jgi:hypothetical protein
MKVSSENYGERHGTDGWPDFTRPSATTNSMAAPRTCCSSNFCSSVRIVWRPMTRNRAAACLLIDWLGLEKGYDRWVELTNYRWRVRDGSTTNSPWAFLTAAKARRWCTARRDGSWLSFNAKLGGDMRTASSYKIRRHEMNKLERKIRRKPISAASRNRDETQHEAYSDVGAMN